METMRWGTQGGVEVAEEGEGEERVGVVGEKEGRHQMHHLLPSLIYKCEPSKKLL